MFKIGDAPVHGFCNVKATTQDGDEKSVLEQKDIFSNIRETHKSYLTINDFRQYRE